MIFRTLCAAFIVAGLCAVPASANPDLGPGAIAATVRDAQGHPISGALVVADGPTSREATTGDAGFVVLMALPVGDYDVRVTRAGYAPYGSRVIVHNAVNPSTLQFKLTQSTFSNLYDPAASIDLVALDESVDVLVAHVMSRSNEVALLPEGGVAAPALSGTSPSENRVEVDGIPVAGGPASLAAFAARNALGLADVALIRGPAITGSSPRNAIGGIVDYRTPDYAGRPVHTLEFGYDAPLGWFEHARVAQRSGKLTVAGDAVQSDRNRAQVLKTSIAFSSVTSLGLEAYGAQAVTTIDGGAIASNAPIYATDLHTSLGRGALSARWFSSTADSSSIAVAAANEHASTRGVQASYDAPAGENLYSLTYDRRSESASSLGASFAQTYATVGVKADIQLSKLSRIEVGERLSSGDGLTPRGDPFVALALRPAGHLTVRLAAGSAFATTPDALLLAGMPGAPHLAPETSFGYRASVDDSLEGRGRVYASLYDVRRFNRFATYADARTSGLEAGYEYDPRQAGVGAQVALGLQRVRAYGPQQSLSRVAEILEPASLAELAGDPYSSLHTALWYRSPGGVRYAVQTSAFGPNNALTGGSISLTDVLMSLRLGNLGDVRLGVSNVTGAKVTNPILAPYYLPHEFELILGASPA